MGRPDLLDQPREIGRRIGAACGYTEKKQSEVAAELGRDSRTLRSYIGGQLGDFATRELREGLIRRIEEITGCPPEIFGLSAPQREQDLQELRHAIAALATLILTPDLDPVARQLLESELSAARQWSTNSPHSGEPATGAGNG